MIDLETIYENMLAPSHDPLQQHMYAEKPVGAFKKPEQQAEQIEETEHDIAKAILDEAKALRKIAKEDNYNSKVYYRARKIVQLASKLLKVEDDEMDLTQNV